MQNYNTKTQILPIAKKLNPSKNNSKRNKIKTISLLRPIHPAEEDCACGSMKSKKVKRNVK